MSWNYVPEELGASSKIKVKLLFYSDAELSVRSGSIFLNRGFVRSMGTQGFTGSASTSVTSTTNASVYILYFNADGLTPPLLQVTVGDQS